MSFHRTTIPRTLLIVVTLIIWLNYFTGQLFDVSSTMKAWAALMWGFAAIYANLMFFVNNSSHIMKKMEYWYFRAWAFVVAIIFIVIGLSFGESSAWFTWLMNYTLVPASNASWLTAFFIFIVSYHKYTSARDWSSLFFVIGLVIATVGQIPMFAANPVVGEFGQWFYTYPGNGVMRAMYLSVAVGMLIIIVRTFLGLQRSLAEKRVGG